MSIVDTLMEVAAVDTGLLRRLDAQGDRPGVPRDVEFVLKASSTDQARVVASFLNDCQYGAATAQDREESAHVLVVVHMPAEPHAIQCASGFMALVCELFGLEYEGWSCVAQAASPAAVHASG